MTQNDRIRMWLESGQPITPLQALERFGCMRLGARIHDLKKAGMKISRKLVTVTNRDGERCVVAQYRSA